MVIDQVRSDSNHSVRVIGGLPEPSGFALTDNFLSKHSQLALQESLETARPPLPGEPQRIERDKILIVTKLSKLDYDMQRLGLSEAQLLQKYEMEHAPLDRILAGHYAQQKALAALKRVFKPNQFISRNQVSLEALATADLVVTVGGDNHFQFVSHAVTDGFILGVNSDPTRSEGALMRYSVNDLLGMLAKLEAGEFMVEEWTRLEGSIDGNPLPRIICEYFLGERESLEMSRYILDTGKQREEQKGSGIIVSTGAGSTGWYDSAVGDLIPQGDIFPRTSSEGRLFVTAPFRGRLTTSQIRHHIFGPQDQIVISSLNDSEGIVGCDALERMPFGRGAEARIWISDKPLKVIRAT